MLYEALRPLLEPQHNGKFVVLHPASGDYLITEKRVGGMLTLGRKHPEGGLVRRQIGPPTCEEVRYAEHLEAERRRDTFVDRADG